MTKKNAQLDKERIIETNLLQLIEKYTQVEL